MNGGALKADIPAGAITIGKMWEVLPFENTLCTVSMTGTQIREVLQYGIQNEQHGMIQYSGLGIQYHRCPETGQHLVNVTLSDGTPLQDEKTYRVAINDFLAEGGDGFIMFRQYAELINTQEPIREMIIKAIEKEQTLDFTADDRFQLINN
jgi:2',3'-cyclic-nucleotide 2'-phosphodiesterase/3'-nucleotidase